jgi:hypothetical protein
MHLPCRVALCHVFDMRLPCNCRAFARAVMF